MVKIVIVLLGIWILYKKLFHNQNISQLLIDIESSIKTIKNLILILAALFLVPLNIYLEGIKWKMQLKPIENINIWKSFLSIFTGITSGMFFPNRMGNFLGRIFMLEKGDRIKARRNPKFFHAKEKQKNKCQKEQIYKEIQKV